MFDDCCCILRQRLKQKSCWNGPIDLQFEKTKTFKQQLTEPYPTPEKLSPSTFHRPRFESFESNGFFVFQFFILSCTRCAPWWWCSSGRWSRSTTGTCSCSPRIWSASSSRTPAGSTCYRSSPVGPWAPWRCSSCRF